MWLEFFRLMKIASFNINGIKARLPRLIEWLTETQPDAVCLQEVKSQDEGFPADEFEKIGYGAVWHGQKSFNGVAILARGQTPTEIQRGLPYITQNDSEDVQARYLEAEVSGVRIASIYLPNGNPQPGPKFDYKLAWMRRLRAHAAHLMTLEIPVVLAGDYNVIPHDCDIWSKTAMRDDALRQPESIAAYRRMMGDGWTDALASHYPSGGIWTYWDYQAGAWQQDRGFRIDHMLLSPQAADRLVSCGVDKEYRGREKASDHAPIWLKLR
jgi:exodeoxyribonuclease III